MTTNIRDGVFETNSSSSHSVTVIPGETLDFSIDKKFLRDGVIVIEPRGYGWEWRRYHTPVEKVTYLLAQIAADFLNKCKVEVDCSGDLRARNPRADMILGAVERMTGCRVEIRVKPRPKFDVGIYIDGNSHGAAYEVMKDEETLLGFLFSKESFVMTGNDNSGPGKTIITDDRGPIPFRDGTYTTNPVEGGNPFKLSFSPEDAMEMTYGDGETLEVPHGFSMWDIDSEFENFVVIGIDVSCGDRSMPMEQDMAEREVEDFFDRLDQFKLRLGAVSPLEITGHTGQMEPWDDLEPITVTLSCVARPGLLPEIVSAIEKLVPAEPKAMA